MDLLMFFRMMNFGGPKIETLVAFFLEPLEYVLEHPRNGNRSVSVSLSTTELVGFSP